MMKHEAKPVRRLSSYLPWQLLNWFDILRTTDMSEWMQEGMKFHRQRWHNQKYYTWVEQQGKGINELRELANPDFWLMEQTKTPEIDKQLAKARGF